jgi:multimeric flavodoxin WrbA
MTSESGGIEMHIVTILGGPRTDGNTDRLLDWSERALKEWRHDVTRINLADLTIRGCTSCFACMESADEPGCVLSDDASGVFSQLTAADAVIYATPLYMWSYASQLKALLDRSICLVRDHGSPECRSFVDGKPAALLVSCAGPDDGNADLIRANFERFADYVRFDHRGVYVFPHCTDVNMLPNVHGTSSRDLARALVA